MRTGRRGCCARTLTRLKKFAWREGAPGARSCKAGAGLRPESQAQNQQSSFLGRRNPSPVLMKLSGHMAQETETETGRTRLSIGGRWECWWWWWPVRGQDRLEIPVSSRTNHPCNPWKFNHCKSHTGRCNRSQKGQSAKLIVCFQIHQRFPSATSTLSEKPTGPVPRHLIPSFPIHSSKRVICRGGLRHADGNEVTLGHTGAVMEAEGENLQRP